MPVLGMNCADGEQGFDAFAAGFADADQNTGGEGDFGFAGVGQRLHAYGRDFVRRAVVGHALLAKPFGGGFEHDAHGGRDGPQARKFVRRHGAGIEVPATTRSRAKRFRRRDAGSRASNRNRVPARPLARGLVAQLRFLAEGEQRFPASERGAVAGNFEYLVHTHVGCFQLARHLRKGAIVANIAAQVGEWNKDLAGVGDNVAEADVAPASGDAGERRGISTVRKPEGIRVG